MAHWRILCCAQDVSVIVGCVLFGALMIGAGNLLADLIAARLDPRIRLTQ